jgi:hypothetical protein
MAVSADLAKVLDKAYEDTPLEELVDAPVAALAGISDATAEILASSFRVKTIGDLGRNKLFLAAAAITQLAESSK